MTVAPKLLLALSAFVAILFLWNMRGSETMADSLNGCDDETRKKFVEMVQAVFPHGQKPIEFISCNGGGTAFASFSHISAEVTSKSINWIDRFAPIDDPAGIPMSLLADEYIKAFEGADWRKTTYAAGFHPDTKARIWLLNTVDNRSFVLITSE